MLAELEALILTPVSPLMTVFVFFFLSVPFKVFTSQRFSDPNTIILTA